MTIMLLFFKIHYRIYMKRTQIMLSIIVVLSILLAAIAIGLHAKSKALEIEQTTPAPQQSIMWVTDPHLTQANQSGLFNAIKNKKHKAIFITGDISNDNLITSLKYLSTATPSPIYFILGNSDTNYGHSTQDVRKKLKNLCAEVSNLHYLHDDVTYLDPTPLCKEKVALIGFDGYADSWEDITQLRENDLEKLTQNIETAIKKNCAKIVILSHVPPFQSDCLYQGKPTTPQFAPHYSSTQFADLLLQFANKYQHITFVVYAGHTHNESYQLYTKNIDAAHQNADLHVFVGKKFQSQDLSSIYEIDSLSLLSRSLSNSQER